MRKFIQSLVLAGVLSAPGAMAVEYDYGIPDDIQQSNILHCFNWSFAQIKEELPKIAAAGFGAVQVSPVQGACASGAEWFYAYLPKDFRYIANGNGSKTALKGLCEEAAKYNIKIIVDVVANHVNGSSSHRDKWWNEVSDRLRYNGGINYGNRQSIIYNQLGDYGDVNSERSDVQQRAKEFIEDLKAQGVKGIRWDAAKHIGLPSENCGFWSEMAKVNGMWYYGEILDGPGGDKYTLLKEYTKYMGVTDTEYSKWTMGQVNGGNVPTGYGSWTPNGIEASKVVYWAESHDDYSNDDYGRWANNHSQAKVDRAYAIVACRANEAALYLSRPSETKRTEIRMGRKGSTHFTSKEVAEVNKFRNAMVGTSDYFSQANGIVCVTRGGGGAVIVVGNGQSKDVSVTNGGSLMAPGTYKDQVSGNTFTVTATTISGKVGSTGIAVVYNPDNITPDPGPGPEPGPDPEPQPVDGITVYYDNSATNYSSVHVHHWGSDQSTDSKWPGPQMTKVTGSIYRHTVPSNTIGVVFNNGGNGKQTVEVANPQHMHLYYGDNTSNKTSVTDKSVYNDPTLGIGSVEADGSDVAPVYYNLQGARVDNPAAGLYIVVRGDKVTKEYIR